MLHRILACMMALAFVTALGCAQQETPTENDQQQQMQDPAEGEAAEQEGMEAQPEGEMDQPEEPQDEPTTPDEAGADIGIGDEPEMGGGDGVQE